MSEAALHKHVAEFLNWTLKPPFWWSSIGHGGGGRVRGAQLKARGLKRGISDILCRGPGLPPLWIELKWKDGEQSDSQVDFESAMLDFGDCYAVCRSVLEVQQAIREWYGYRGRAAA